MSDNRQEIPPATIASIDMDRIRTQSASDADEIERLDARLDTEDGTDSDLISMCELLVKQGEADVSFSLLRSNVLDMGDEIFRALRRLHGHRTEEEFDAAIFSFQCQFGVKLISVHPSSEPLWHFMEYYFRIDPVDVPVDIPEAIRRFLSTHCEAVFKHEVEGTLADINGLSKDISDDAFVVLRYVQGAWTVEQSR